MRIAISGSHRTGKSTLLSELSAHLPDHTLVEEPYRLMEEEGYEFAHPPALEDFEAQLQRSIDELGEADEDTLLDRCPVDFLPYLALHEDAASFDPLGLGVEVIEVRGDAASRTRTVLQRVHRDGARGGRRA